jgi:protoporphyrinogen IX oxidase
MMNLYDLYRGLHILAVIAWMAGLLYLPRLFVYHIKHAQKSDMAGVFLVMEQNLLKIIMTPAMIATWVFGLLLIHERGAILFQQPWFIVKILGVIGISGYHGFLSSRFKKLKLGQAIGSEKFWRMANEIPFVLAIIMVLAVTTEWFSR